MDRIGKLNGNIESSVSLPEATFAGYLSRSARIRFSLAALIYGML